MKTHRQRRGRLCALALAPLLIVRGEVVDRIAVTVDKQVITVSDIIRNLRVSAFLDHKPVDLSTAAKRAAATRLVEQALILQEAAGSHYDPLPEDASCHVDPKSRYPSEQEYQAALTEYHITEADLAAHLLEGQRACEFTDQRFGPEVQVSEQDLRNSYNSFAADWPRSHPGQPVPTFEDSRNQLEELLTGQRITEKLDDWLKMARDERRIEYREAAFP